ncbi:YTH domain-containing protein 2 [Nowakowskiella sp. JEL0078]|nr:YTH domain-containing protein 2 [Nowakowskiella sp. JEL0078]
MPTRMSHYHQQQPHPNQLFKNFDDIDGHPWERHHSTTESESQMYNHVRTLSAGSGFMDPYFTSKTSPIPSIASKENLTFSSNTATSVIETVPELAVDPKCHYSFPRIGPSNEPEHKQELIQPSESSKMTTSWATIAKTPAKQPNENLASKKATIASPTTSTSTPRAPQSFSDDERRKRVQEMLISRGLNPSSKQFNTNPTHARYFVIKSYTEDDIHKSLKYSIWASTEIGNRRLNQAYQESMSTGTPIYLLYSVNASGHFCGIARMASKVDWERTSTVWAQDGKWKGSFGVKWIFVKDIPNAVLRHLRVINNENKPVTNSRDTQELMPNVGREILRMFSEYKSKTCILDDWMWYDKREEDRKVNNVEEVDEGVQDDKIGGKGKGLLTGDIVLKGE